MLMSPVFWESGRYQPGVSRAFIYRIDVWCL